MKTCIAWMFVCILICLELIQSAPTSAENHLMADKETFIESYVRRMKSWMNTSVDPCDNFYKYACGNYPNVIENLETPIKRSNLFDVNFVLIDLVDAILKRQRDPNEEYYEEMQIATKFVDTCSNAKLLPIEPSEEYLQVIKSIGGFPAVDRTWDESSFDWFNMTAHLSRYGIVGFVDETILPTFPFKPFYKMPKLGFGFDVYPENIATNSSEGYVYNEKIMRNLLQTYGVSSTDADEVIEDVFDLLRRIAELQVTLFDDEVLVRKRCYELSAWDNLKPSFEKWVNLFKIAWDQPKFSISYESYCPCDWFYNKLDILAEKKPKAFANYLALKFLFSMHLQLESTKFQRRECVALVKAAMPMLFSHFFMKEHYQKEYDEDIQQMILELEISWKHQITEADWLNDAAHDEALKKLKNLRSRIGRIVDPVAGIYIKEIRSLNVTNNVALNNLQLAKFKVDMHHYGHLHPSETRNTASYEILDSVKMRAFYLLLENKINLMAGLFYPPVYHKDFPYSLKYGGLGYVIGHEIGHGFQGIGLRITSNLTRHSWLSKKSNAIAQQRSSCFADDYDNFQEPAFGFKLNGRRALSEIEADSLGLRQALRAYKNVLKYGVKHEGDEFLRKEYLPGFNLSQEQTFFLAFAQLYCAKYEPKHYWNELNAKHPISIYRVMGTLRNFDEFSNVFNCPSNSGMNPSTKCRLW